MQPQMQREGTTSSTSSPWLGLVSIFYSPSEAYESAGRNPWLIPLIAATLLSLVVSIMVMQVIGMETIIRNSIEASSRAEQLGPEGVNKAVQQATSSPVPKLIGYAASLLGIPIVVAIVSGLALGGLLILGGATNYSAVMGAVAWATYAGMLVRAIGTGVFLAAVTDFQGVDTNNMVMLNASIFFDPKTSSKAVVALASGFDLIAFWTIYLQSLGLAKLSQRVTMSQALTVSIGLYLLWVFGRAGMAMIF